MYIHCLDEKNIKIFKENINPIVHQSAIKYISFESLWKNECKSLFPGKEFESIDILTPELVDKSLLQKMMYGINLNLRRLLLMKNIKY